ncbi:GNAT family N-acetyltransferase [Streptomyces sp. NPDC018610]|uniref:GNAT family N-acetyltransferase n=1 Tax=Streptomyces sp. NPDC018610 TaxID=3365049 RepID=UPI0037BAB485
MLSYPLAEGAELRGLEPWQAQEFYEFIERARTHLAPWLPWATQMDDPAKVERWLRRCAEDQARDGGRIYGIWLDGLLVGGVEFAAFRGRAGICELGAWLAPEAEGRGLVTLAARRMIEWAVGARGITRVEWRAATDNARSLAVAKRLGMEREGVLRSAFAVNGVRQDLEIWSFVADLGASRDRDPVSSGEAER